MTDGMRPINLKTDLAQLADLIELVFADSMDGGGRAALREMRALSRMGPGLSLLSRVNEVASGVHQGYVWIDQERVVGNVSVYAARWPKDLGNAWVIANVGVYPDYRRMGIARELMQRSMGMVAERGGTTALLQVDASNEGAKDLYRQLGFVEQRTWTLWRRNGSARLPRLRSAQPDVKIERRRWEWQGEYELAQRVRCQEGGGLGWLRPLHESGFRRSFWRILGDWLSLRGMARYVIKSEMDEVLAALWIEARFMDTRRLTLMVDPRFRGVYDEALLRKAIDRAGWNALLMEHPDDEETTAELLKKYQFMSKRTTIHMRWDVPR
jgi:ribosomal protein S18 acetylase RimI-like enzyme